MTGIIRGVFAIIAIVAVLVFMVRAGKINMPIPIPGSRGPEPAGYDNTTCATPMDKTNTIVSLAVYSAWEGLLNSETSWRHSPKFENQNCGFQIRLCETCDRSTRDDDADLAPCTMTIALSVVDVAVPGKTGLVMDTSLCSRFLGRSHQNLPIVLIEQAPGWTNSHICLPDGGRQLVTSLLLLSLVLFIPASCLFPGMLALMSSISWSLIFDIFSFPPSLWPVWIYFSKSVAQFRSTSNVCVGRRGSGSLWRSFYTDILD